MLFLVEKQSPNHSIHIRHISLTETVRRLHAKPLASSHNNDDERSRADPIACDGKGVADLLLYDTVDNTDDDAAEDVNSCEDVDETMISMS